MENQGPLKGPPVVADLAKVAQVLRDMEGREFEEDRDRAFAGIGVDLSALPAPVVELLSQMSPEELSAVIRFNDALVQAGLVVEPPYEEPGAGPLGFF
jgi:hypothetical protein